MKIRPFDFSQQDYEAVNTIWNKAHPMYPSVAEDVREDDEGRPKKNNWRRYVLEHEGEAVGFGVFLNAFSAFHPQEFLVTHVVMPEHHGRGFGKALHTHMLKELKPFNPIKLMSWSREDWSRKRRFLEDRGFSETMRSFESRLDLSSFDNSSFESELPAGINLKSFKELADDPDRERKIYELHTTIDLDVPLIGEYTKPEFETFAKYHWLDERFIPELYLIATDDERYVGMTEVFKSKADDTLHTGLTGVLREYRKKGVALALKLRSLELAQAMGAPRVSTWNESNNKGMLAINEKLGYQKEPATIDYVKVLNEA